MRAFNGCADDDVGEVKNHNPAADHHRCGLERLWKLRAEFIHFFLKRSRREEHIVLYLRAKKPTRTGAGQGPASWLRLPGRCDAG